MPVSYTHLDVYKRQGIVMSIITIVLAVINAIAGVYLQTSNVLNQL